MRYLLAAASAVAAFGFLPAGAAVLTIGSGPAHVCYEAARADRSDSGALQECNRAIDDRELTPFDRAATRVNRGIILINRDDATAALADFDEAIRLRPNLGEAHVNRGAALILAHDYTGAVESITRGLTLDPEEPHKAYFNRALAYEAMGNVRAAYADYRRAQELSPSWDAPQRELARYTVTQR